MADPVTYTFYGTTIPVLRRCCTSAISTLTAAQNELAKAEKGTLPSEQEILDAHFGTMYPFRMQPIMLAKFSVAALEHLSLTTASIPSLDPSYKCLSDVIDFFKAMEAVYDAVDEQAYNESAEKSVDVPFVKLGKTLHMKGFADYFHGFVIPNSYFHLNAMYMLLRSQGFQLGKGLYVGCWMSEQQQKDWAPLRG
jgi:hypothetical protein